MQLNNIFQFIRFGIVGVFVAGLHFVLVYALTDILGMWYLYATTISYIVAMILSFVIQKFYVMKKEGIEKIHTQFIKYVGLAILCMGINAISMFGLVEFLYVPYLYAQIIVLSILALFTFFMYRTYIFR